MSEPKFYTVFEADSAYLKALGDTNTYFSEFEVRLKTLEALGGKIDNSITSLLEVEKKILETVGGIATTTNDIFELRKEIAKAQGLDVSEDFNIWDVAQQEPSVGPKIFTIRFLNWDGTVLQTVKVEEGQTPVYGGTEPTKESDETYDYTFNGWLPEISPANGNVDYVAQFTATEIGPKIFTIRFLNWDGTVLQTVKVEEGQTPVYGGTEPTKESDETYNYTFNGWLPEISPANGNVDYVAQFTATEIPQVENFVTFRAEQAGSTLKLNRTHSGQTLQYSTDKSTWNTLNTSKSVKLTNVGDEVYVRGKLTGDASYANYTQFEMTGKIAAYGNCNALWNYENLDAPLKTYCGYYLFRDCTSLTKAPELPATTLESSCYSNMFRDCTSLTKAPELPATTLAASCYAFMFRGCTSLTKAPKLQATTLALYCYSQMFYNCTALQEITCLATNIGSGSVDNWVSNVPSGGTFYKDPSMTSWTTGKSGIPEGWTVVDYAG